MKNILLCFVACLSISSCVKQKSDVYVKGQILNAADSLPISNASFVMYEYTKGGGSKMQESIKSFSTDNNGYFGFTFPTIASQMKIFWSGDNYHQGSGLPITTVKANGSELDFGKIYTQKK